MRDNPIQFAAVREDPAVELALLADVAVPRVLLVGSGGCTALTISSARPDTDLLLVDMNRAQLALVRRKVEALADGVREGDWCLDGDDPAALDGCGNFESLFRVLRTILHEFVATDAEILEVVRGQRPVQWLTSAAYWPVAFALCFADAPLVAMFGPDAVQHAPKGAYPAYFQAAIERGLGAADRATNRFLHQILLGRTLPEARPPFLIAPPVSPCFDYRQGRIEEVPGLERFDLVAISNVLDWMDDIAAAALCRHVAAEMRPGAVVVWRQLYNPKDYRKYFTDFDWLDTVPDRSLFYASVHAGRKR